MTIGINGKLQLDGDIKFNPTAVSGVLPSLTIIVDSLSGRGSISAPSATMNIVIKGSNSIWSTYHGEIHTASSSATASSSPGIAFISDVSTEALLVRALS